MGSSSEFSIPFEGLKIGKHFFEFGITTKFFEGLSYSIIKGGDVNINFSLDKKESMMIGHFVMEGTVQKSCDRCMELVDVPISVSHQVIYKFADDESTDEDLILIPSSAFEIDISNTIYELLTVALPSRTVHEQGKCNPEMLNLLDKYLNPQEEQEEDPGDDDEIDPRWDALKNLN